MNDAPAKVSANEELAKQIKELSPWHMGIQINDELNTGMVIAENGEIVVREDDKNDGISLLQLRNGFLRQIDAVYPDGVSDKTFLDCACNAGGYGFWLRERGLKHGVGFDVREHWIKQALFVQKHRTSGPTDQLDFQVADLYDLPKLNLEPADITMFKGIFYHLPDPITGMKLAADLTKEHFILNTSIVWGEEDGYMKYGIESRELLMSGVHGLRWFPTGPKVLAQTLKWMGFEQTKLLFCIQIDKANEGRVEIHASRTKGFLDNLPGEYI